jgi:hypothetical protein
METLMDGRLKISGDYDHSIHSNPDAVAWAKFYKEINPDADESLMLGWFANAMMAMHDHIYSTKKVLDKDIDYPFTQGVLTGIDSTPDVYYPIRILEAYRENCNCKWVDTSDENGTANFLIIKMNKACDERALILDRVISVLKEYYLPEQKGDR